jgi:biopolymer transport protein ExbB/TolQ
MNESLPIREMIVQGWPIFSVLVIMSIISLGIMLERWMAFNQSVIDPKEFLMALKRSAPDRDFSKAIAACKRMGKPLASIAAAILSESGSRAHKERIMHRAIQTEVQNIEKYVFILGTIASIAPFVGLLGTVIGIIKAFHAISISFGGGPGVVAAGIAEALVNTAMGLVVAIPAVVAFNYFSNRTRRFTQEWEIVGGEIVDWAEGESS